MSKAATTEIDAMGHLATEVDRCRPIDRQRVAELVRAGAELHEKFGSDGMARITAWLITRAKVDTDEALHTADLRRQARAGEKAEPTADAPPAEPAPDPEPPTAYAPGTTGVTGHPLADCDVPGRAGCEEHPDQGHRGDGPHATVILHHAAAHTADA